MVRTYATIGCSLSPVPTPLHLSLLFPSSIPPLLYAQLNFGSFDMARMYLNSMVSVSKTHPCFPL
jgi:hypothetical protein